MADELYFTEFSDLAAYGQLLETMPGWSLFQTPDWLRFLDEARPGRSLILALKQGTRLVGFLPGREQNFGPIRIFASPFPGWTTPYMGPALKEEVSPHLFFAALESYLKRQKFHHCELVSPDPRLQSHNGWSSERSLTYLAPLCSDPAAQISSYTKSCQKTIKQAKNKGVIVEFTDDPIFIDIYYKQLHAVFAKRKMLPTYPRARIESLWRHLKPPQRLLTTWAKVGDQVIATRIDIIGNGTLHAFGSASEQSMLNFYPNEILRHHVMNWAGQHGMTHYDLCGGGYYKHKFNATPNEYFRIIYSRTWLRFGRNVMRRLIYAKNLLSFFKNKFSTLLILPSVFAAPGQ